MDVKYLDFELEIGEGDAGEHSLRILHSPAGVQRGLLRLALSQIELENRLLALQNALLRSGGSRRRVLTREEEVVRAFGNELFDALFQGDLRALYFESKRAAQAQGFGLRLKLRIVAPALAALPWEYLFDVRENEYVCLSHSTPVVRFLEAPQPPRPLRVTPPLRILGMVASPRGLPELDVALEKQRLERAVEPLRRRGLVELEWLEGETWRDLSRAMRPNRGPWHVFHFIGHGGFDHARGEGILAISGEGGERVDLAASELARLLADHRTLRLVVLNACEGGAGDNYDIFSSTAATLVRRGLPAVVAMQYEITDRAAIEFAEQFYDALADGLPVDTAITEARKSLSLAIANTLEWGIPVLFMQTPEGLLFEVTAPAAAPKAVPQPVEQPAPATPAVRATPEPAPRTAPPIDFDWVEIPAGPFWMGSNKSQDRLAYDDETPQHELSLPTFRIARAPVTNAQYKRFVDATGRTAPEHWRGGKIPVGRADHPVVYVSWSDAQEFCRWAGLRLPSEAEWEKAARGTDKRIYPWGNEGPDKNRCNFEGNVGNTTPVGAYPNGASPYGVLDMAGNVWEWTSSLERNYPYVADDGREDAQAEGRRVLRGGAFHRGERPVRCAYRGRPNPHDRVIDVGFRVVSPGL